MANSRRIFTKEFKALAVQRLAQGVSPSEIALDCGVSPNVLHRWRRESIEFGGNAFAGYGNQRGQAEPRTRAIIFRLTDAEYKSVLQASNSGGARSISDFVRQQILRATGEPSLACLDHKLTRIALAVERLSTAASGGFVNDHVNSTDLANSKSHGSHQTP